MKKVLFIALILGFVASIPFASFATTTFDSDGGSGTGIMADFKTSDNVQIHVSSNATSYAATSGHLNGDKAYGAASSDSIIYVQDKTEGQNVSDPGGSDSSVFSSGWEGL